MKKQAETILEVPAIVLANLCVSHIMISQNEEAEELMRKVGTIRGHKARLLSRKNDVQVVDVPG